jgi:hypothetical protein
MVAPAAVLIQAAVLICLRIDVTSNNVFERFGYMALVLVLISFWVILVTGEKPMRVSSRSESARRG